MRITVHQAQPGDVLLDSTGKVWLRSGRNLWSWTTFDGPVAYYGDWKPEYGPVGKLFLLVRDGKPHCSAGVDADTVAEAEQQ